MIHMELKEALDRKKNIKELSHRTHTSLFQLFYKTTVIKTVWHWHKYRHTDQWNVTENPEINPYFNDQFIFNKNAKIIQ